jgi:hypothetical protein
VLDVRSEPPVWSRVLSGDGDGSPPGRRNGCAVFDVTSSRLFIHGGTSDGATTQPGLFVLDARPGKERWTKLERPGEPPPRSSGFGFHHPATRSIACGFGNDRAVYQDLAELGY